MSIILDGSTGITSDSSASNPAMTAKGNGSDVEGYIQLNCRVNSHGVKLKSPPHSSGQSYTMVLPDNQVAANKFLKIKSITGSGATAVGQLEYADVAVSSPTENYAHVTFGNTYDSNSGYVIHNITAVEGNGITGDTTNNRLTPTVAGFYLVMYNANWSWPYTGGTTAYSAVYKNGGQWQRATFAHGSYAGTGAIMVLIGLSMNGSSDYVDFRGYENRSGTTAHMTSLSRAAMFLLKAS
tara:strand:- start:123 stop:839 length:717 start_codon:yes stop_codon:yes gene_type:complete